MSELSDIESSEFLATEVSPICAISQTQRFNEIMDCCVEKSLDNYTKPDQVNTN